MKAAVMAYADEYQLNVVKNIHRLLKYAIFSSPILMVNIEKGDTMVLPEHAYYIEVPAKAKNIDTIVEILINRGAIDPSVVEGNVITEIVFTVNDEEALINIKKLCKVHTIY